MNEGLNGSAGAGQLLRRASPVLRADPRRTIFHLFLPGQEVVIQGGSRADTVIERILAMSKGEVADTLAATQRRFPERRQEFAATCARHFAAVAHRLPSAGSLSAQQQELIGAYFTQQYAVEAAALFNPSLVAHPDQTGLDTGYARFVLSLRAVGEGHLSSIEFRTGIVDPAGNSVLDELTPHLTTGHAQPASMSREFLRAALAEQGDDVAAAHILGLLPDVFGPADLEQAMAANVRERVTRSGDDAVRGRIRWLTACHYHLSFPPDRPLSERVIFPNGPDESHGVEDARFTRFRDDDGSICYFATYTAFDGSEITSHLLRTTDFTEFDSIRLIGPAAHNKGMALFPRRVGGTYRALARWDRESIGIAESTDTFRWERSATVKSPQEPWELIQLGNCGPPIETEAGWLVFTHGVGPVREYQIGAVLLDLEDPTRVIGSSPHPLLTPTGEERHGYVPDVVYSCGGLLHGRTVVLPYGCSDSSVRFASVDLDDLLGELH